MAEIDKFQAMEILTEKQKQEAERRKRAKKRNYIVGLSITGALALGLVAVYVLAANVWLLDVNALPYVEYEYSNQPDENGEITATITGYNKKMTLPASFRIPSEVNGLKVTKIAEQAFGNCKELVHVTMPDSIIEIGDYAFALCENLETFDFSDNIIKVGADPFKGTKYLSNLDAHATDSVNSVGQILFSIGTNLIPDNCILVPNENSVVPEQYTSGDYNVIYMEDFGSFSLWTDGLFLNNDKLVYVEIPETLEVLPPKAFKGCTKLEEVKFPATFDKVSESAFENCSKLEKITFLSQDNVIIEKFAFASTGLEQIDLSSVTQLGEGVFKNCSKMTSFVWPYEIADIPASCFENCTNLTSFNWDDDYLAYLNVQSIGKKAFYKTKINEFVVPMNVPSIGEAAFKDTPLEKIYFFRGGYSYDFVGNSVQVGLNNIGKEAFRNCPLSSAILIDELMQPLTPENVISMPFTLNRVKNGNDYTFANNDAMTKVIIPLSIKETSEFMFQDNRNLEVVEFREFRDGADEHASKLTNINRGTFKNCTSLRSIELPQTVKDIGNGIFEGCSSLEEIILSDNIKTIKENTFKGCVSLKHLDLSTSVNSIKSNAFNNVYSLDYVYIPYAASTLDLASNAFRDCREDGQEPLKVFLNIEKRASDENANWHDETVKPYFRGEWEMIDNVPTPSENN